jgi:phosphoglycerol transferase
MIFQFPYVPFLGAVPANTAMVEYDELKGYLHSNTLRWSGGAMIGRDTDMWIRQTAAKPVDEMAVSLARAGFAGLYIDRFGYPDRGALLEAQLKLALREDPIVSSNGRRSFFVLDPPIAKGIPRPVGLEVSEEVEKSELFVQVIDGCWPKEGNAESYWQWCGNQGQILFRNPTNQLNEVQVKAWLATGQSEFSNITISTPGITRKMALNNAGVEFKSTVLVPPGEVVLSLRCDAKPLVASGDPRMLIFLIRNLQWSSSKAKTPRGRSDARVHD